MWAHTHVQSATASIQIRHAPHMLNLVLSTTRALGGSTSSSSLTVLPSAFGYCSAAAPGSGQLRCRMTFAHLGVHVTGALRK